MARVYELRNFNMQVVKNWLCILKLKDIFLVYELKIVQKQGVGEIKKKFVSNVKGMLSSNGYN